MRSVVVALEGLGGAGVKSDALVRVTDGGIVENYNLCNT